MLSAWHLKIFLALLVLLGLIWLTWLVPAGTQAQGGSLPTPTNIGDGGGNGGSGNRHKGGGDDDSTPIPPGASVSGFVYGYSDKAYVGEVKVVVGNGGWQAETLTDSNGYYQVGGLGAGPAVVNLTLPPGATPVVFDWPIWLSSGSHTEVNLGYYWHDPSALPVLLSGAVDNNNLLTVQIMNQTGQTLPGSVLEVTSPPHILLPPTVQTSQGSLTAYDSHRWRLALGDLAPQANVTTSAALKTQEVFLSSAEAGDKIRLIFTYDQQKTPLMLDIQTDLSAQAAPPPAAGPMAATASATPPAPPTTSNQPMASAAPTRMAPLPTTGQSFPITATSQLFLALFLILGLGVAGWQAKKRNQN